MNKKQKYKKKKEEEMSGPGVFILLLAMSSLCFEVRGGVTGDRWHRLNLDTVPTYSDGPSAHPKGRRNAVSWCTDDDEVYVYGGKDTSSRLSDMWRYEESTDRWLWLPGGPGPALSGMVAWSRNDDQLWMYGGRDDGGSVYADLWRYDRGTRVWTKQVPAAGPSPGPRFGSASWYRASTNTLYLYGGRPGTRLPQEQELWTLDMPTLTWTLLRQTNEPGAMDDGHSVIAQNKAYLFGGANQNNSVVSNTLWTFNLDDNTWTSLGQDGPSAREDFTMWHSVTENALFLFGGKTADKALDEIWRYHIPSATWSRLTSDTRPSSRWGTAVCTDDEGYAFLFGGMTFDQTRVFNDVWKYGVVYSRPGLFDNLDRTTASAMLAAVMSTLVFAGGVIVLCVLIAKSCASRRKESHPLQTL